MNNPARRRDGDTPPFFSGLEPELSGYSSSRAPMLGGSHRVWPSIAAHLLSEQHHAHRRGDMPRVWAIRRLRARIQMRSAREREETYYSRQPLAPLTDLDALGEMQNERNEVAEELEENRQWLYLRRAADLENTLAIMDEYIAFWCARLDEK
jgi:hypothetical protein